MTSTNEIIDLTNDVAFKSVFSNENYKWYLSFIISYCTKMDIDEIFKHLKYKNNFIGNRNMKGKTGEGDILVEVKNKIINIEMNRKINEQLLRKNKKYITMLDGINTEKSKNGKIKDKYIIQINISTKARIRETNELLYEIVLMDRNLKIEDEYNNYIIYDINLEYLKKELYNKNKLTPSEKRLLLFIERDMEKLKEIFKGDERMKRTVEDLETAKYFEAFEEYTKQFNTEEFKEVMNQCYLEETVKEETEKVREKVTKEAMKKGREKRKHFYRKNI